MTQDEIDVMFNDIAAYEKEIADHNEQFLKTLGKKAQKDFDRLLDCCNVTGKINLVDAPKGNDNNEDCGIFKNVHVEQWCVNMEGDSFEGNIYANVKGQWIEVPFYC